MCGRYSEVDWEELHGWLNLIWADRPVREAPLNIDVRPTTHQRVVLKTEKGWEPASMLWGLIPYFFRGKPLKEWKAATFNARAETVQTAATFKSAFARRRCLVPVANFYEWRDDGGSKKQTYAIHTNGNEPGLVFAGLWDRTTTADGELQSFTIVTHGVPYDVPMRAYHERAPLTLSGEDRARWLDTEADVSDLLKMSCGDIYKFVKVA